MTDCRISLPDKAMFASLKFAVFRYCQSKQLGRIRLYKTFKVDSPVDNAKYLIEPCKNDQFFTFMYIYVKQLKQNI